MTRLSIPTRYLGTRFRSKLEADWARAFDALGIPWRYEHEGRYFGDVFYLPDFWLPACEQYVEVKAIWKPTDLTKVNALCRARPAHRHRPRKGPEIVLVAAEPDGWFHGWPRADAPDVVATDLGWDLALFQCRSCAGHWFDSPAYGVRCRCCGHVDSWPGAPMRYVGYLEPWPMAPQKAA